MCILVKGEVHVWKRSDMSGLWQAEMECSGQIVEFSAHSVAVERESKEGEYLLCPCKVWKVFLTIWEVLQVTAGHCLLLKWVFGELTVHWLMWPATAVGTVPVDMPDCLLWPCRQVLGPGEEPIVKCDRAKPDQPDYVLQAFCTHTHMCTLTAYTTRIQTHMPLGEGER